MLDISKLAISTAVQSIVVVMERTKETKGALLYTELDADGDVVNTVADGKIGQQYIRKSTSIGKKAPAFVRITVEVIEGNPRGSLAADPHKGNGADTSLKDEAERSALQAAARAPMRIVAKGKPKTPAGEALASGLV